jgi:hypothetical protein
MLPIAIRFHGTNAARADLRASEPALGDTRLRVDRVVVVAACTDSGRCAFLRASRGLVPDGSKAVADRSLASLRFTRTSPSPR